MNNRKIVSRICGKYMLVLSICILFILAFPHFENEIYCEAGERAKPDLTLIYSGDINGYYKPCG